MAKHAPAALSSPTAGEALPASAAKSEPRTDAPAATEETALRPGRQVDLLPVRVVRFGPHTELEVSAHLPARLMRRDLSCIFRSAIDNGLVSPEAIVILPTIQHTVLDILAVTSETAKEKDDCLERFVAFAQRFCSEVSARGFWADFCDPCSGLPTFTSSNTVYAEIQALEKLRRFPTTNAGGCRVAMHPRWGSAMYPASMFTSAPVAVIEEVLLACDSPKPTDAVSEPVAEETSA